MAAPVVNEPAGSAKTWFTKGGTKAFLARSTMSRASSAFLPPMKMPVRVPSAGDREKIESWVSDTTSARLTSV